jgi:hypothetical protein
MGHSRIVAGELYRLGRDVPDFRFDDSRTVTFISHPFFSRPAHDGNLLPNQMIHHSFLLHRLNLKQENCSLIVPWVLGFIGSLSLEALAIVYSNVLRDHINQVNATQVALDLLPVNFVPDHYCNEVLLTYAFRQPRT